MSQKPFKEIYASVLNVVLSKLFFLHKKYKTKRLFQKLACQISAFAFLTLSASSAKASRNLLILPCPVCLVLQIPLTHFFFLVATLSPCSLDSQFRH